MFYSFNEEIKADYENNDCMLFNCDCRNLLKNIESESIDLFCSDIPYKLSTTGGTKKKERQEVCWRYV